MFLCVGVLVPNQAEILVAQFHFSLPQLPKPLLIMLKQSVQKYSD